MTAKEALQRADRHCDLEGLPPTSALARELDTALIDGRILAATAVAALLAHHQPSRPGAYPLQEAAQNLLDGAASPACLLEADAGRTI